MGPRYNEYFNRSMWHVSVRYVRCSAWLARWHSATTEMVQRSFFGQILKMHLLQRVF